MKKSHLTRILLVSLASGWIFDQLFWKHTPGISILIFVLVYLAGLLYLTLSEKRRPTPAACLLLAPTIFFAVFTALRLEPFTLFICLLMTAFCLLILTMTWAGGKWIRYSLVDYFVRFFLLLGGLITLGVENFASKRAKASPDDGVDRPGFRGFARKYMLPVGIGLLLAIPAVAVLASILSSADPIFSSQLENFWGFLFELNIGEIILRGFYVLVIAYFAAGAFLFAIKKSHDENLIGLDKPVVPQFFNWISSATVIACIDLLFAFFVYIQFRYFFGGQANIAADGYTYAEYARRGFNELLVVAFLSLLIFLSLSAVTRRAGGGGRWFYSMLGVLLVLLVGVILFSGFQRLGLYEAAYGFSRIRTYSHVFMVWLGALLAATVVLEITNRLRAFALVSLLAALGFGATLALLNVDGFIVRQNLARSAQGEELDLPYLVSLSDDVAPDLYRIYTSPQAGSGARANARAALACRYRDRIHNPLPDDWQSFHFSHATAAGIYRQMEADLPLTATNIWGSGQIIIEGEAVDCEYTPASYASPED